MRAKSMVLLLVALGFGLVASIGVSEAMLKRDKSPVEEKVSIYVAAADINIGDKLDDKNARQEEWPKNRVPEGAVIKAEDMSDKYARTRMFPGEAILAAKLMNTKSDVTPNIPPGHRAVAANVTVDTAVAGLIRPGDRVDIVGFFRKNGDIPETTMRKILQDVRIFAVNTDVERQVENNAKGTTVKTVTFLILEEQVETLMLAMEMGNLRLALRNPDDLTKAKTDGVATTKTLLGGGVQTADTRHEAPPAEPKKDFLEMLREKSRGVETHPVSAPAATESMVLMTPTGTTTFHFHGDGPLPEVTTGNTTVPAGSQPAVAPKSKPEPTRGNGPKQEGEEPLTSTLAS